jgi:hypothetical protein
LTNNHGRCKTATPERALTCVRWGMVVTRINGRHCMNLCTVITVSLLRRLRNGCLTSETAVRQFQKQNGHLDPLGISFLGRTRFRIHGAFWKFSTKKCRKPQILRAALTQDFVEAALQAAPLHRSQTLNLSRQSQSRDSTSSFGNQPQILGSRSTRLTGLNSKTAYFHWP